MVQALVFMVSWMPSPLPQIFLGLIALVAIVLVIRLVALILSAIPFL